MDYLINENHTAPITEALFQTSLMYNLLEKLGHMDLASRLVVSLLFCQLFLLPAFNIVIHSSIQPVVSLKKKKKSTVNFCFLHFADCEIFILNHALHTMKR
jgi:hypothetical protein